LINNRQGGRRRGRGAGGGRVPNNAPSGNRQDNRQRGNAAQLLEKYKQLARDAQLGGDRVQSEYYLQFADHYFRVLNENRARFEDQRPRHRDDDYGDEDEGDEEMAADGDDGAQEEDRNERPRRDHREIRDRNDGRSDGRGDGRERSEARDREPRGERNEPREMRGDRNEPREPRGDRGEARPDGEQRNGEGRFAGRPRRPRREANGEPAGREDEDSRIALDILPPAISIAPAPDGAPAARAATKPANRRPPRPDNLLPSTFSWRGLGWLLP
jgi:hypothetical protein